MALPFFGIGKKTDVFQSCNHCWLFQIVYYSQLANTKDTEEVSKVDQEKHTFHMGKHQYDWWSYTKTGSGFFLCSVQFSCTVVSTSLQPHGLQHARPPCASTAPRACSNSCPLSLWSHPTTSSSVVPFSFCFEFFPASGSFLMSQFFTAGGQNIEV